MKLELEMQEESVEPEKIPVALEFEKKEIRDKLNLILQEYQDQKRGVEVKLKKLHSDMYAAILFFVIVFLVDAFFSFLLKQPGSSLLAFTWEMWVACIALFIAMWKLGMNMIKKIAEYHIHNETGKFNHLKEKSGSFTLKAEGRFCEKMEKETRKLLDELFTMPAGDSYEKYAEIQYVEKRADEQVFEQYGFLWYGAMVIIFILLYVVF